MTTNIHLVSIITACYNSEKHISDSITSVLNQTHQNWELLLVDDCSHDRTISIIKNFKKVDDRIRLFKFSENFGAAVARNKAIEEANGRFIAFLDSDDKWLPHKLEQQITFMLANSYNLTHTAYGLINESGNVLKKIIVPALVLSYKDLLYSNRIGCLTAIYDQSQLGKVYMPLLRKRQDYGLWLKILKTGEKAYGLPMVLSQYRKTQHAMSSKKINLIRWNWKLWREVEGLSLTKSAYFLGCNVLSKFKS